MGAINKKKLIDEITIGEMKRLREESNMTNREIAVALDVSYQTVVRYIGKQPSGMGASCKWAMDDKKVKVDKSMSQNVAEKVETIQNVSNPEFLMDIESECVSKTIPGGSKFRAVLDYVRGEMLFSIDGREFTLKRGEIEDAATFLRLCANRRGWRLNDAGEAQSVKDVSCQPVEENAQEALETKRDEVPGVVDVVDPDFHRGLTRCKCPECGDTFYFNNKYGSKSVRCKSCGADIRIDRAIRFRGVCECGRPTYGWAVADEQCFDTYCLCGKQFEVKYNEEVNEYRMEETPV